MKKVFTVVAMLWEYEDSCCSWTVVSYLDQEMAELHAQKANQVMAEFWRRGRYPSDKRVSEFKKSFPYDNLIHRGLGRIEYTVHETEFCVHLDEYLERTGK